jgi:hypothetical protein
METNGLTKTKNCSDIYGAEHKKMLFLKTTTTTPVASGVLPWNNRHTHERSQLSNPIPQASWNRWCMALGVENYDMGILRAEGATKNTWISLYKIKLRARSNCDGIFSLPSPFGVRWQAASWWRRWRRQLSGQIRRRGRVVRGRPPGGGSVRVHYQNVIAAPLQPYS